MNHIRTVAALLLLAVAPAVFAHPGHPALSPQHTHAPLDLNPVALILLGAIAIGVVLVGCVPPGRPLEPWRRNKK